jgi:hypothetical protein
MNWLLKLWGKRAPDVAAAYRRRLNPSDADAKLILRDLAAYCNAGQSAAAGARTPHDTAIMAGRQDAFAHIAEMLKINPLNGRKRIMSDGQSQAGGAATGTEAAAGTNGGGAGAAAQAAYDWGQHGEAFKPFEPVVTAKGWKNPLEALSAYAELESKIGKSLTLPGPDAKPEDWAAFFDKAGRPKDAKGYGLKRPDSIDAGMLPDDMVGAFGELAHKLGLLPDQAAGVLGFYTGRIEAGIGLQKAAEEELRATLQKEWGPNFDKNMRLAQRAVQRFGGDEALAALGPLENALGGAGLAKFMHAIGAAISEDTLAGAGSSGGAAGMPGTAEGAKAKIATLKADGAFLAKLHDKTQAGHAEAVAEWRKLHEIAG